MNNKKSAILFFIIYLLGVCTVVHAQILYTEYTNSELESSEVYLSSNIYQKDFILFVDMLKTTHPIFAFDNQNIVDLNAIEKEGYVWTSNCTNIEDLKIYLQTIMARLNDGHSFVLPDFDRNALYPFQVFVDIGNDSVYLFSVDKPYQKCLGKKILEINHFPVM
ncbi:MAG: hypothetical protein LBL13_03555, partial [Bacteroidales bacterium]|nr:hypothetical protein [Bacteroidales bacterium]